jgi:anthranilate phosphoribosyltransferase
MKEILEKILSGQDLTEKEMGSVFDKLMTGELTPAQISAFISLLRMKGESIEEITGAAGSMRKHAVLVDTGGTPVVDTCGTGGDTAETFNISTAAAFVTAGAGVPVAKHGNRAVSSQCGSADVLAELGLNLDAGADIMAECIQEIGIGFLFAPKLHPSMKYAAGVRKELGIRTIFNMLGPLTNPAGAKGQILGVFNPELTEVFASVLRSLGSERAYIVYGNDGMDEITVTTTTRITELRKREINTYEFEPTMLIEEYYSASDIAGGNPAQNAQIIKDILNGIKGAKRDIVLLNAAAAIAAGNQAEDIKEGFETAKESIDSGNAAKKLNDLIEYTN